MPNLERALWSAGDALTLIVQDKSNEMRLHKLPWPAQALLDLGDPEVELRVTLSYFVEPNRKEREAAGPTATRGRKKSAAGESSVGDAV